MAPFIGIDWYKEIADKFDGNYTIYGIQARGFIKAKDLPKSVKQMSAEYLKEIKQIQKNT